MSEQTVSYDVASTGGVYQIKHEHEAEVLRISIYADGQFRFSLSHGTPREEVEKFVQVYALGVADGRLMNSASEQVRQHVGLAARRLGRAAGHWKASVLKED
jgi:hypothetical protein